VVKLFGPALATFPAIAVLVLVVGCESHGLGPAAISRDGSDLLVVVCEDFDVNSIYGEIETVKAGHDWTPFLDLSGEATLRSGVVSGPDSFPGGLVGTWGSLDFDTLEAVNVLFEGADTSDSFQATFYGRGFLEVPAGKWLQTNGLVTSVPCSENSTD